MDERGIAAVVGARVPSDPKNSESLERKLSNSTRSQLTAATPCREAAVARASVRDG